MTGREEMDKRYEERIDKLIDDMPTVIKDFRYELIGKTASTKEAYVRYIRDYYLYCNDNGVDIVEAKKKDINKYMEFIKFKPDGSKSSTAIRRARLAAIKKFYSYLYYDDIISKDPSAKIDPPNEVNDRDVVYMTPTEVKKLKDIVRDTEGYSEELKARDTALITLGCQTGLRISAMLNINIEDINLDGYTVCVYEKGNKKRDVILSESTVKAIRDYLSYRNKEVTTNALFLSCRNNRMTSKNARYIMGKYTKCFDKHITPHKMRSTCATNVYEQTGDIYATMEVLGHKNISNTRRYAKVSTTKVKEIATIMGDLY